MSNYDWLISRLDAFIRKYYANQLLRGSLVLIICVLLYVLTVSVGEYYLYLPAWLKVTLVSLFIVLGLAALVVWIVMPLAKMARLGKVISHEQAATIVGQYFPEISDKLLNILQLRKSYDDSHTSRELIAASIDQKAAQISVVPITSAIDLSKNRRYLPYLLPLLLVGVFILVAAPNVFKDASARLLQPTKTFEKPAPFTFIVTSMPLKAVRNGDFVLKVRTEGDALPADMAVAIAEDRMPMQPDGKHSFQYTLRNVTGPVEFRLMAAGFYSQPYTLQVVQKPLLKGFKVSIDYPAYTGRKDEVRNSLGDMTLPTGTLVSMAFVAEYTDNATVNLGDGTATALPKQGNMFAAQYRFLNDTSFTLTLSNKQTSVADSYRYMVNVIPDEYPVIQMQEMRDSISGKQILLTGTAGDDYGISKVLFHYTVTDGGNKELLKKNIALKGASGNITDFQHYFDIQQLNLLPGQKLSYYIEAWDNDGVHGSKASRSEVMSYQMYSPDQIDSAINENAEMINSGLSNSAEQMKQLQNEYKDLQSKMLQSESMDWEQQQSLQQVSKMQEQLKAQMEAVKKRLEEQVQQSKQKEYSQDVKDKQEALQKQMDNLLNKELAEQMRKLNELMKKLNKDQAFQTMKQLEQENKLFNMDMERMQELMKQLEMQMRLEDLANKMDELAAKQDALKDKTDKKKESNEALAKQQDELKKELDKAMSEEMKDMQELNKDMQRPQNLDDPKEQAKEAGADMEKSEEQLKEDKNNESSESQSKASEKMKKMASAMRAAAGGMNVQQIEMDKRAVRQILTNLMRLSFDQEQLMKKGQNTPITSQSYIANQHEQSRLRNNSRMIRDSLFSLSKRLAQLSANINKETTQVESNMAAALDALESRRVGDALTRQQYVMTHTNNLALMLNEILANLMEMQAQAKSEGEGQCSKPGGAKPKPGSGSPKPSSGQQLGDIITKQQGLGNAMQQAQDAQQRRQGQQGSKEGESKDGKSGGQGEGNAEQIARLAEQQAAIRRQLQQLNSLLNSKGLGNAKELKEIMDKMDKNETDLVNRRASTSELQLRQKEILTRLLQAEKSLREQEQDDKRSSKAGEEISRPIPAELQKFLKDRQQVLELYKTVPPQLKPYYRNIVEQYYRNIGKDNTK
jgi:hypothetical protein